MKRSASIDRHLAPLSLSLGLLILWELVTRLGGVPVYILPAPTSILRTLVIDAPRLIPHTLTTLQEALLGFGLAVVFALILSILLFHRVMRRLALRLAWAPDAFARSFCAFFKLEAAVLILVFLARAMVIYLRYKYAYATASVERGLLLCFCTDSVRL